MAGRQVAFPHHRFRKAPSAGIAALALALLALLAPSARGANAGEGGVLIVGDSMQELTSPHLAQYLPGVRLTINAVGGYNTFQIFDLFQESYDPSQSVIVFDGGTNDNPAYPQILAENLQKVSQIVGDRCLVVPTVYGYTVNGVDNTGKNRVVREFAASRPGTQTPDWARVAETRKDLMQPDDLHPTETGADVRARLIAQGIQACLSGQATLPLEAPAGSSVPSASVSAAPVATDPVEATRMKPVARIAERRAAIVEAVASGALRQAAAVAAVRILLPGG